LNCTAAEFGAGGVIRLAAGEALTVALAEGGHWYGHGFSHVQPYPLETGSTVNEAFAALLKWWGGTAGLADLANPAGLAWYRGKLEALLELGADGFKIDGGDFKYHPPRGDCAWPHDPGASGYSDILLRLFEELTPNRCEIRTAWASQRRQVIWREGGKDSHWGLDNGLRERTSLTV
jgi:hypothetical protein